MWKHGSQDTDNYDGGLLRVHPELDPAAATLPTRLAVVATIMPELVAAAAAKAIAEWGRPARDITHLVFSTPSSVQVPAIDLRVASLLGLSPTVQLTVMCSHGCTAKDIAENNRGARILVACADILSVLGSHVPDDARPGGIIAHALFGDGTGAVVVGADPQEPIERPVFEMVSASQATVLGTEHVVAVEPTKGGTDYRIEPAELMALPGALGLELGKLAASRLVLSEYGNMIGPTLIFVLDEVIRRRQQNHEDRSCKWGFMVGLGPGFTIEVMTLHACSDKSTPTPRLKSAL
ncbi:bisdemethoxycurcumin synthase-like [Miscanthus floridulus]|uniref:bisdemethoxycurcumin synthase-like n=1 Tax=Miscanthus floridulus TaxID=154761 RepID=UPI0034593923